ncbi:MAG: hypothetical protein K1X75_17830 [Leptospirales bacterium]|nr:hypothetical protein [Leptospirales bacterium]
MSSNDSQTEAQIYTDRMLAFIRAKMDERDARREHKLRGLHPKHIGLAQGEFVVPQNPPELAVGLFAKPGRYKAFFRFSNGVADVAKDRGPVLRGFAIRVYDVAGEKLYQDDNGESSQDFILNSYHTFGMNTVREFYELTQAVANKKLLSFFFNPFNSHIGMLKHASKMGVDCANPLDLPYYSMTTYRFGDTYCKWMVLPKQKSAEPATNHPNALSRAFDTFLRGQEARFDFCVQKFVDERRTPHDNERRSWSQSDAPPQKVAELIFPKREVDSATLEGIEHRTAFNPWHTLREFQPVGEINDARGRIYQEIAAYRRK